MRMSAMGVLRSVLSPLYRFKRRFPLLSFIAGRVATMVAILFVLGFAIFGLMELAPGDIVNQLMIQQLMSADSKAGRGEQIIAAGQLEATRADLGLDKPFYAQYFRWLERVLVHGDLGVSLISRAPVLFLIGSRLANSVL